MAEPEHPHAEPAELDMDIGAARQFADLLAPRGKDLVALASVGAEADRTADMVEPDWCLGKGARQIDQLAELGVVHPGVKAETERGEAREPFAYSPVHQQA